MSTPLPQNPSEAPDESSLTPDASTDTTESNPAPQGEGSVPTIPRLDVEGATAGGVIGTTGSLSPAGGLTSVGTDSSYVLGLPRPEPVLDAARLGGLISALAVAVGAVLTVGGLASAEEVNRWVVVLSGVVSACVALAVYLAPVWQAHKARRQVTPLVDPRDAAGRALLRQAA